jgi:hypothetical protein
MTRSSGPKPLLLRLLRTSLRIPSRAVMELTSIHERRDVLGRSGWIILQDIPDMTTALAAKVVNEGGFAEAV